MRPNSERVRVVTLADGGYPPGLLDLPDPPAALYVRGILAFGGIAIVGSRTPPPSAAAFARDLASRATWPVISGLALGIDAAAHRGALSAKLSTVAYIGHGFGCTYPPEHAQLEEAIVAGGGGIASERRPGEPVAPWALVKRDRLQAAHARVMVMISSESGGGAMHTIDFATQLRRTRYVIVPPRGAEGLPAWGGNQQALADGATPLPFELNEALAVLHADSKLDG